MKVSGKDDDKNKDQDTNSSTRNYSFVVERSHIYRVTQIAIAAAISAIIVPMLQNKTGPLDEPSISLVNWKSLIPVYGKT